MKIYTVGYEGCDIEDFVQFLKKNKIKMIADLRKNPVSRKKGFSKNKLAEQLALQKIDYAHFKNLGTPTEWRKQEKAGKISREKMFQLFVDKVIPQAQADLENLLKCIQKQNTALLCFEKEASDCHRHFVAEEIARQADLAIENLSRPIHPPAGKAKSLGPATRSRRVSSGHPQS